MHSKLSLLSATAALLNLAKADCSIEGFENGYNASGSITVPGFQINDSYPSSRWSFTRSVSALNTSNNEAVIIQDISLQTDPAQNLTNITSITPFNGCIFALTGLSTPNSTSHLEDGTCTSTLSSPCIEEINERLHASALLRARNSTYNDAIPTSCDDLWLGTAISSSRSKCADEWFGATSMRPLTGPRFDDCDVSPGTTIASNAYGPVWSTVYEPADNYTLYDNAILGATPVVVVAWERGVGNETSSEGGWADVRLMCISARDTEVGSRTLNQAESANGAAGRGLVLGWVFGFMVPMVLLGVLM